MVRYHSVKDMSKDEWLQWRNKGVGASEVPTITGHNEYQCSLELFYKKLGAPTFDIHNLAMLIGTETEDVNATFWQYWEGSEKSVIDNYKLGRVIRQSERVHAFAVNDLMPSLFVSLDRRILPNGNNAGYGALEFKNTNSFVLRKYENNVVPSHLIQLITQIGVCEFEYGEIAYMFDNKHFDVFAIPDIKPFMGTFEKIVQQVGDFWKNVLLARPLYNQMINAKINMNMRLYSELEREISALEPPVQNSQAYKDFLKERYKDKLIDKVIKGTPELLQIAIENKTVKEQIKELENKANYTESTLRKFIGDNKATKIDFGRDGYVSWKQSVDGKIIFNNKIK